MKKVLLASAAAIVSITSNPVWAQAAADEVAEGDIVVTATRGETLLSKTPLAVTAISGDDLKDKGIVGPTGLAESVPNLSIDRTNGLQITIRGVTSTDGTEKGNPSAAFLLDGVYLARPQQADIGFFDVERVEVLRGPQGTLYGRNTTAGVVNVITNKPKIGVFEAGFYPGAILYLTYWFPGPRRAQVIAWFMTAVAVWMSVYRAGTPHHAITSAAGDEPGQGSCRRPCRRGWRQSRPR